MLLAVPQALQSRYFYRPDQFILKLDGSMLTIKYPVSMAGHPSRAKSFNTENELDRQEIIHWQSKINSQQTEYILHLDPEKVLVKILTLPIASERDLKDILGHEMDRQTPFAREQVYYDYLISSHDSLRNTVTLELYVTPRTYVDPLINKLKSCFINLSGISIENKTINLLPESVRLKFVSRINPLTKVTAAIAIVAFLLALYIPVLHMSYRLTDLKSDLGTVRENANLVRPLVSERQSIIEQLMFLSEKRRHSPLVINLLAELTENLPDDTYLERITIRGDEIQINGESSNATRIIQLLENSDSFSSIQPRSPVTKINQTDKERFHVSAIITGGSGA